LGGGAGFAFGLGAGGAGFALGFGLGAGGAGFALGFGLGAGPPLYMFVKYLDKFDRCPCFFFETILPCLFLASLFLVSPPEVSFATPEYT